MQYQREMRPLLSILLVCVRLNLVIGSCFLCALGTRFGADIGPVNSLILVVRANDEPYGDFRFSTVRMMKKMRYDCAQQMKEQEGILYTVEPVLIASIY